jgi:lipid-binding SYLF domain-containing protein
MKRQSVTMTMSVFAAVLVGTLVVATACPARAAYGEEQDQLVDKATLTVIAVGSDPGLASAIRYLQGDAKALFIVPQFLRGAFLFGGAGGSGVLIVRDQDTQQWSEPVFYNIGSASFGLQVGVDVSELIFVVLTQKGLEEFYHSEFKLGGDVSLAVGLLGEGASVKGVHADIIAYARKKGGFVGISLEGAIIKVSDESNAIYYGKPVRPTDIVVKRSVSNPGSADLRNKAATLMQ